MNCDSLKTTLDIISTIIGILGVPGGIFLFIWNINKYFKEKKGQRAASEQAVYDALDDKYIEFLKLCAQYSHLNISTTMQPNSKLTPRQSYQIDRFFEILVSLMERAYLMYANQDDGVKKDQWKGWEAYIRDWKSNPVFSLFWKNQGTQWSEKFTAYMNL